MSIFLLMIKHFFILFFFTVVVWLAVTGQGFFDATTRIGSFQSNYSSCLHIDSECNVYVAGYEGDANQGSMGMYISKIDPHGNLLWRYNPGFSTLGATYAEPQVLKVDAQGYVYLFIELDGALIFPNVTITSDAHYKTILVKLDSSEVLWWKRLPQGSQQNPEHCLEVDDDGNSYILSNFSGTEIFGDDTLVSNGGLDVFITKISPSGNFIWSRNYGTTSTFRNEVPLGLDLDNSQRVFALHGLSYMTSDGHGDSYIIVHDTAGNFISHTQVLGLDNNMITSAIDYSVSQSGISHILLELEGPSALIKDHQIVLNDGGVVLVRYDASMNFLDELVLLDDADANDFMPEDMEVSIDNDIYIGGKSWQSFTVNSDTIDYGFFTLGYDQQLNLFFAQDYANNQYSSVHSRIHDLETHNGQLYFACSVDGLSMNFPNLTASTVNNDGFVCRINIDIPETFYSPIAICEGDSTLIFGQYEYQAGTFGSYIADNNGCVTEFLGQELIVDASNTDTSIFLFNDTLFATQQGVNYQWVDCNNSYQDIAGANDRFYFPSVNGYYAVILFDTACFDTSSCLEYTTAELSDVNQVKFQAFPNPTNGIVNIQFESTIKSLSVRVSNTLGKEAKSMNFNSCQYMELELNGKPGLYFINLFSARERIGVIKVLKVN